MTAPVPVLPEEKWVWWDAGPDGGYRVGPKNKGAIAMVFTIEEAVALCKASDDRYRSGALLKDDEKKNLILAGIRATKEAAASMWGQFEHEARAIRSLPEQPIYDAIVKGESNG